MKFNPLIPELMVRDLAKSLAFYEGVLGFGRDYERLASGFAFLSFEGSQLMLEQLKPGHAWITGPMDPPLGRGVNFQITVQDLGALQARLKAAAYPVFAGPEDHWRQVKEQRLGDRELLVQDPDGYLLRFSQSLDAQ